MPITKISGGKTSPEVDRILVWIAKAASDDETRYFMNGVRVEEIDGKPESVLVIATDGRMVHSAVLPKEYVTGQLGLGVNALACWRVLKSSKASCEIEIGREIDGQYPNWPRVVPEGTGDTVIRDWAFSNTTKDYDPKLATMGLVAIINAHVRPMEISPYYLEDILSSGTAMRVNIWRTGLALRFDGLDDQYERTAVVAHMKPDKRPLTDALSGEYHE